MKSNLIESVSFFVSLIPPFTNRDVFEIIQAEFIICVGIIRLRCLKQQVLIVYVLVLFENCDEFS